MICHHYKCIFVHIPKNAGQSIEHVFLNLLGLQWETRAPLLLRENDKPELGPPRLAHLKADEYVSCKYIPQWMFDDYFKFAFVRNPWSRVVSIYKYFGYHKKCSFKAFLMGDFKSVISVDMGWFVRPQAEFIYNRNGEMLVDYVGKFETLQQDFDSVSETIGIPVKPLPHINQSRNRREEKSSERPFVFNKLKCKISKKYPSKYSRYQDYYDQESVAFVTELYSRDVVLFNYKFDESE